MKSDVLSTRQVAQLLGVGEASVKRWADAGEIDCFRTPGGHRKFRLRDVTGFVQKRQYPTATLIPETLPSGEGAALALAERALAGDIDGCVAQLALLRLRGPSLAEIFDDVVSPALASIGERWSRGDLSIAQEHVASQAIIDTVARSQPLAEPPGEPVRPDRGAAVVAVTSGDQHDIGARMASCLLRARGFEVLAPLAQTPARDLADLMVRTRAVLTVLTCTVANDAEAIEEQVRVAARAAQQTGGRFVVGGAAMRKLRLPPEVKVLVSMRSLVEESDLAGRRRHAARPAADAGNDAA
jgi:excisionase family DNA binding protein